MATSRGTSLNSTTISTGTITRPADTTNYTAGDVIDAATGAGVNFTGIDPNGVAIADALLLDSGGVTVALDAELWLFDTALTAYANDNVAVTITDADMLTALGVIVFATGNRFIGLASGNSLTHATANGVTPLPLTVVPVVGSDTIYGVLVARNAYEPLSAEVFTIRLKVQR